MTPVLLEACPTVVPCGDIGVWPKSDPQVWTAGNDTHCCARWGSWIQDAFLREPAAAHLLIRRHNPTRVLALVMLFLGIDRRTLLVNSVELANGSRRFFGGARRLLHILKAFLVPYAKQHGLTRIHASCRCVRLFGVGVLPAAMETVAPLHREPMYTDLRGPQFVLWRR